MGNLFDLILILGPLSFFLIFYYTFCNKPNNQKEIEDINSHLNKNLLLPNITICGNEILLNSNNEIEQNIRSSLEILKKRSNLYIIINVKDEVELKECEEKIINEFKGLIDSNNILFSQNSIGRASIARQLEPIAHFDFDPETIHQTSIFIPSIYIGPDYIECPYAKWSCNSFFKFITNGKTDFFNLFPVQ